MQNAIGGSASCKISDPHPPLLVSGRAPLVVLGLLDPLANHTQSFPCHQPEPVTREFGHD
jgi:hypothetical protein